MKAVLLSIQPQHIENICTIVEYENGKPVYKKRIDVRKTRPKLKLPFKCLIYCTKGNNTLNDTLMSVDRCYVLNSKVIGEFICDKITDITGLVKNLNEDYNHVYHNDECKGSCLTWKELQDYGKGKPLYGWHISDLKIYDKPKELSEFKSSYFCETGKKLGCWDEFCKTHNFDCVKREAKRITKPPQSWQYVEV